ncbi:hypothetical protein U3516DRAFT_779935 [Neocallimastix sp. 'constans']
MINLILVGISIILSVVLVILLLYIRHLKSENTDGEREPLLSKYTNISISEEILSRFGNKKPRIQKSREIANNFKSGEKIEDTFSILNKIDKEELLIVNQLSSILLLENDLSNNDKASSSKLIEQNQQDPIDLNQIPSDILSKSYGKSVPNNSTLDILKFKLYQQELEKKKKDKSVYSGLLNQYDSTYESPYSSRGSVYKISHDEKNKFGSFTDHYVTIDEQGYQQDAANTIVNTNKPPLYSVSMMSSSNASNLNNHDYKRNNKKNSNNSLSKTRLNTNTKSTSVLTNNSLNINNESYHTPVNPINFGDVNSNEHDYENNYMNHNNDNSYSSNNNPQEIENLKSLNSNDGNGLSSPSTIMSSPKLFKDTSSPSIILPRNIDDSVILDMKQEQQVFNLQAPQNIPNSNVEDYNVAIHPSDNNNNTNSNNDHYDNYTSLNLMDNNQNSQILINSTANNNIIKKSNLFSDITNDLSINNNISELVDEDDDEDDYSENYSHSSFLSQRRGSTDYSTKRLSRASEGSSSSNKNIANSTLFTSSLPPISRPIRIQSLPKSKSNSTDSGVSGKKTMAKAQDYIALSQRSFPVRANFIPDISFDDEIKLNTGDLVVITDVYLDAWAKGINIMTNSTGVFPLCYLNTDEPQAQAKTKRFTKIVNQDK